MTAAEQYAKGHEDGRYSRQTWTPEQIASGVEQIEQDIRLGIQPDLKPYWIGYVAGLEGRAPLFTTKAVEDKAQAAAEEKGKKRANQLRRTIGQLRRMQNDLDEQRDQESREASRRIELAIEHMLIAAHYLEGNV